MFPLEVLAAAGAVNRSLIERGLMIVTAESCTGGLIAGALTAIPGSSDAVFGGYVTYSNEAKAAMIGVDPALIERHGAVSEAVARAMAEGARKTSGADVALAVTGVAGPGGGTAAKPVGLVHFAFADGAKTVHLQRRFGEIGRDEVRMASVRTALELVLEGIGGTRA